MSDKRTTLDEAVGQLRSGMTIGIGGWGSRRKPMAFVRALLRTDVTDLTVVTYGGPDMGLLCSAGKVKRVYYGFVSLDSPPFYDPWFAKARTTGSIEAREMDEGMLRCGLQAAAQRLPFLPIRGIIGSDLLKTRGDWKIIDNPFAENDPIVVAPAIHPDVALFHAPLADRAGNVFIGTQRELVTMAHAARRTIVTVEDIHDGDLLRDPLVAAGTLPGFYIEAIAVEPRGAWPLPLPDRYVLDAAHLSEYAQLAATAEGFAQYLDRYVYEKRAA